MFSTRSLVAALTLTALSLPAAAQQRVGADGRALDANGRVGSGGTNAIEGRVDYNQRNDLVTGNVTDFSYFRGDVPYRAPGEFRGRLGTDDQFRFRADSYGSNPIDRDYNDPLYGGGVSGRERLSIFRDFSQPGQGRLGNEVVLRQSEQAGVGGVGGYGSSNVVRTSTGSLLQPDTQRAIDRAGVISTPDGRVLEVTASPLLGVRRNELNLNPAAPPDPNRQIERVLEEGTPGMRRDMGESDPREEVRDVNDRRVPDGRVNLTPIDPFGSGDVSSVARVEDRGLRVSPGLVLGQQLQSRVDPRSVGQTVQQAQERIARLERAVLEPPTQTVAASGDDVYLNVLDALAERAGREPSRRLPAGTNPLLSGAGGEGGAGSEGGEGGEGGEAPAYGAELPSLTQEQLAQAEQARREMLARQFGANPLETGQGEAGGEGGEGGETSQESEADAAVNGRLAKLMEELGADLPRLESLAGASSGQTTQQMKEAEALLAKGSYMQAEAAYRRVLQVSPQHVMARIGLANAELGAGLFRSAALTLRGVLTQHPRLVTLQYDAKLLPDAERAKYLQGELQRMVNERDDAADAGLLMAYLGYQLDSRPMVRYGLAVSETYTPRDPLLPVLRAVWLEENGAGEEGGAGGGGE